MKNMAGDRPHVFDGSPSAGSTVFDSISMSPVWETDFAAVLCEQSPVAKDFER
jgi:hypothetical protein